MKRRVSGCAFPDMELETFGQQSVVIFRTDVAAELRGIKDQEQTANEDGRALPKSIAERMEALVALQEQIAAAKAVCGEGPFVAFAVKLLPADQAESQGHPQMLSIFTDDGAMKDKSGVLFTHGA